MKLNRFLLGALALSLSALLSTTAPAQYSEATPAAHTPTPIPTGPRVSYSAVHVDGPYIALTFDDGPSKANTPRLLDLLAKRGVKVTFFVLGENVQENPEILKREIAEGHEIGNHSWNHPNLRKLPEDAVHSQLERTQDVVFQIAGIKPKIMRPPYGEFSEQQRKWANEQFGYKTILWEVDPLDWKKPGPSVVARRILDATRPGYIVLSHDIHAQTIDAMPEVIDGLLAKGYKFVTVSELIALESAAPKAAPSPSPSAAASSTPLPPVSQETAKKKHK